MLRVCVGELNRRCFILGRPAGKLTLPSFGEFTGGYDITLAAGDIAYVVADEAVVKFGHSPG